MKLYKYSLILILGFSTLVSCSDKMDLCLKDEIPKRVTLYFKKYPSPVSDR